MSNGIEKLDLIIAADEIRNLKCRYFRFVDTHDWNGLARLFCTDAAFDSRRTDASAAGLIERGQLSQGRDAILKYIAEGMADAISFHSCHGHEVIVETMTEAHGIVAMEDRVVWGTPPVASMHGFGRYHEQYRFEDGTWQIWRSILTRSPLTKNPAAIRACD